MPKQIGFEEGFEACKRKMGELLFENVMLRATVEAQDVDIEALRKELAAAKADGSGAPQAE